MNKVIIVISFFIIVIGVIFVFIYFAVEKPAVEESVQVQYNNFSVAAYSDGKLARTGYAIVLDNSNVIFKESVTDDKSYVHEGVTLNHTIQVFNKNLDGQHFYTDIVSYNYLNGTADNTRVNLNLVEVGNLSFNVLGNLSTNTITTIVTSTGEVRDLMFCVRWSEHIITVKADQYSLMDKVPTRLTNQVDKCFDTKTTLKNESLIIFLTFDKFGSLSLNDKMEVYFIDKDYALLDNGLVLSPENSNGDDVGLADIKVTVI
jgi:hypothetical protein